MSATMVPKREAELKAEAMEELRKRFPAFLVLQSSTAGAPDRAIVGAGRTSYWEFKHGTPDFESPGLQELMCARVNVQGYCRFVIWQESSTGDGQRTMIVHPRKLMERSGWKVVPEKFCVGFNHHWLIEEIAKVHRV